MSAVVTITPHHQITFVREDRGMSFLRSAFAESEPDRLNFVLFSTSGVHGTYRTIEEAGTDEESGDVTFLLIRPRTVCMVYGNCRPETTDDIRFLKMLRKASHRAVAQIGK